MKRLHYILLSLLIGLVGTSMHFAHHVKVSDSVRDFFCHFFPIGETCWEHMKMIFFPMLLLGAHLPPSRLGVVPSAVRLAGHRPRRSRPLAPPLGYLTLVAAAVLLMAARGAKH